MNLSIFKAYDIRGRYPDELNESVVSSITEALAAHFKKGKLIIGHDARLSSPSLYKAVLKTVRAQKLKFMIVPVGLVTTPMLYFLVCKLKAAGGIMITASHTPKEFNGMKVVGPNAVPLSGTDIKELIQK